MGVLVYEWVRNNSKYQHALIGRGYVTLYIENGRARMFKRIGGK